MLSTFQSVVRPWLQRNPLWMPLWAMVAAFSTYFCMYAFRKPFAAATWEGDGVWGTEVGLKTALVVSQIVGYALSKLIGVKVCSESDGSRRALLLVGLIGCAELALLLLAVLPRDAGLLAMFLNGLPLGMVWGLVVSYLEGRRVSEVLLAGLSVSFIVSSGVVKDAGLWWMAQGVSSAWMPAVTGACFFPLFVFSVWMLEMIPPPTNEDVAARSPRSAMDGAARWAFVRSFGAGLAALIGTYVLLTAYRDYRDNFGVEILGELGVQELAGAFSRTEVPIAVAVLVVMGALSLVRSNGMALRLTMALVGIGCVMPAVATWLREAGHVSALGWMVVTGLGCYLAYVPFNSVLFERLMAFTRARGNAVFAIYLADTSGYAGVIALLLVSDQLAGPGERLAFMDGWGQVLGVTGAAMMVFSLMYFRRHSEQETPQSPLSGSQEAA